MTVRWHLGRIQDKLGFTSRVKAVLFAFQTKIASEDELKRLDLEENN